MRSAPFKRELLDPPWALWSGRTNQSRITAEKHADACAITIHVKHGSSGSPVRILVFTWYEYYVKPPPHRSPAQIVPILMISTSCV